MQSTDREPFIQLLAAVGEIYNKQITKSLARLYWNVLVNFELQDIINALEAHVRDPDSGQYMPKPADVIRVINGNGESRCLQAWTKVERAIRHIGPYQSIAFDDAAIHAVLEQMGGWIQLCTMTEKNLPFIAKEFQTRYKAYRYQGPKQFPSYLAGLNEHQNRNCGFLSYSTILVGDKHKANTIMRGREDTKQLAQL